MGGGGHPYCRRSHQGENGWMQNSLYMGMYRGCMCNMGELGHLLSPNCTCSFSKITSTKIISCKAGSKVTDPHRIHSTKLKAQKTPIQDGCAFEGTRTAGVLSSWGHQRDSSHLFGNSLTLVRVRLGFVSLRNQRASPPTSLGAVRAWVQAPSSPEPSCFHVNPSPW